jgi:hypothetical protein
MNEQAMSTRAAIMTSGLLLAVLAGTAALPPTAQRGGGGPVFVRADSSERMSYRAAQELRNSAGTVDGANHGHADNDQFKPQTEEAGLVGAQGFLGPQGHWAPRA